MRSANEIAISEEASSSISSVSHPAKNIRVTVLLSSVQRESLTKIARVLVDQSAAQIIVSPQRSGSGHWFGGGNMVQDSAGTFWLAGRYRNAGDSRTGLGQGERGLELAIFRSDDRGKTFEKAIQFNKSELGVGDHEVLSIEGTALRINQQGVQLFLSTEKTGIDYPTGVESFLKPGTGVWTVDRMVAKDIASLVNAPVKTVLSSTDPRFNQVKDPFVFDGANRSELLFCTHPYNWSSSNTATVGLTDQGEIDGQPCFDFFPRGFTWDVAMTRGTSILELPSVGIAADQSLGILFYDGGECVRDLDEHASAVKRPRGYSCEELGGAAIVDLRDFSRLERLSVTSPLFISPHGTGCSRYVDVLTTEEGYFVTWQQSQADGSQPLVLNFVPKQTVDRLLVD